MPRRMCGNNTAVPAPMRTRSQCVLSAPKKKSFRRESAFLIAVENTFGLGSVVCARRSRLFSTKHSSVTQINRASRHHGRIQAVGAEQIFQVLPHGARVGVEIQIRL